MTRLNEYTYRKGLQAMSTPGYGSGYNDYGSGGYQPGDQAGYGGYASQPPGGASYGGAGLPERKNGLAVAALVLGIIAILATLTVVGIVLGVPVAVVGVIVAIIALVQAKNFPPMGARRGMAIAGLVLSLLSLAGAALLFILVATVFSETGLMDCMGIQDQAEMERCIDEAVNSW